VEAAVTNAESSQQVPGGWYWNPERFELRTIPPEGGTLPGEIARWRRLPGWLLLSAAPIVGGLFVIGLPVYGAAIVIRGLAVRTLTEASRAARALATSLSTRPATGEAHLGGKAPAAPVAKGEAPGLDEVDAEIARRKALEKQEPI
jgi:hypothetical protein